MTRDQIVTQVMSRCNLTSATARARVEDNVVERYRWVLRTVGMVTSTRGVVTANTVIDYRYVTFFGIQKLLSVFNSDGITLNEVSFDELRNRIALNDPPRDYAISSIADDSTTIFLDCIPKSIYTLSGDAQMDALTLGATDRPAFPSDYHDILVYGAKAIELRKMEKGELADEAEAMFARRLSELRYFIAVSAYKRIYQGKMTDQPILSTLML